MKKYYQKEWKVFKLNYKFIFIWSFFISVFFTITNYIFLLNNPEVAKDMVTILTEAYESFGIYEMSSFEQMLFIFFHNLQSAFIFIMIGIIPFLYLSLFSTVTIGALLGIAIMIMSISDMNIFYAFTFLILPHGIFEIPAVLYSTSIGVFITAQLSRKIIPKYRKNTLSFRTIFEQAFWSFILVVVPLLFTAAVIETFITPLFVR